MHIRLWDAPYNGGYIWWDRANLRRFDFGWDKPKLWWAIFGFSGSIQFATWPWSRRAAGKGAGQS